MRVTRKNGIEIVRPTEKNRGRFWLLTEIEDDYYQVVREVDDWLVALEQVEEAYGEDVTIVYDVRRDRAVQFDGEDFPMIWHPSDHTVDAADSIMELARECALEAIDQGATEVFDPLPGDWDTFGELGFVGDAEKENQFMVAYRRTLKDELDDVEDTDDRPQRVYNLMINHEVDASFNTMHEADRARKMFGRHTDKHVTIECDQGWEMHDGERHHGDCPCCQ